VRLKAALCTSPLVLHHPRTDQPFRLHTDASDRAVGAVLSQLDDEGVERVVACSGKKLSAVARRWPVHERELYAYVHAFLKWRYLLVGAPVQILSDHKLLIWLATQQTLSGKQARWLQLLQEYNYSVEYVPGERVVRPGRDFPSKRFHG